MKRTRQAPLESGVQRWRDGNDGRQGPGSGHPKSGSAGRGTASRSLLSALQGPDFTSVLDGDIGIADQDGTTLLSDLVAVRTRFKNNFFADAAEAGIRQAVILAAGRRTVGIDLRDDWRAALRAEGFDEATPSA